jgi:hypothetical protein
MPSLHVLARQLSIHTSRRSLMSFGIRRVSALCGVVALLSVGFASQADAAILYESENVNAKVSGGEAVALNLCMNDARDGVIQTQQNACDQIADAGNIVELDGVSVYVFAPNTWRPVLFSDRNVTVELTGGLAAAMNLCLNDAEDGIIQNQSNACRQSASAGNIINLTNVGITVST